MLDLELRVPCDDIEVPVGMKERGSFTDGDRSNETVHSIANWLTGPSASSLDRRRPLVGLEPADPDQAKRQQKAPGGGDVSVVATARTQLHDHRLCHADIGAEEEEPFSRLWPRWEQMHDDDHAGGYVFTTAMRLCSKRRARSRRELVGDFVDRPSTRDEASGSLDRQEIFAALSRLSVRQRQAVTLRDRAGFETDEVAAMLGMTPSTVRMHLARGREALRATLGVKEREA